MARPNEVDVFVLGLGTCGEDPSLQLDEAAKRYRKSFKKRR